MKTMMLAAAALVLATTVNTASTLAAEPSAGSGYATPQTAEQRSANPHYEWHYHYGKAGQVEAGWVLVR